jgi:hypothetical protein
MKTINTLALSSISKLLLSFLIFFSCATLELKPEAMAFTINVPGGSVQLSGNPIRIVGTTSTQSVTDHRLLCKVTCTDGAIPGGPWIDRIQPLNGSATFDISGLVDTVFNYEFDIASAAGVIEHETLAANIEIEIGEEYIDGNGALQTVWDADDPYEMIVLKGELELNELTTLAQNGSSFNDKYIQYRRHLTQKGNYSVQEITVSSIADWVKCWAYMLSSVQGTIAVVVYYSDGSQDGDTFPYPDYSTSKLYEFNAHFYAQELADPDKTPIRYTFQTTGDIITVNITNQFYENHDELLILNRFGAVEDLHCYGEATTAVGTGGETYSKPLPASPTVFDATLFSEGKEGKQVYKINTGFKTKQERLWIKDLLLYKKKQSWLKSEKLPWLTGETFGICPVIITTTSADVDTTGEDVKSIELEIQLAH